MSPENIRFAAKEKFQKKILVWIAISERGISVPLFRPSTSVAISSDVYINEFLEQRLIPFIEKHHNDLNYIFWPDLASAHRSKVAISWMSQNINYVSVDMNPPNVPKSRPIEDFWGLLA